MSLLKSSVINFIEVYNNHKLRLEAYVKPNELWRAGLQELENQYVLGQLIKYPTELLQVMSP